MDVLLINLEEEPRFECSATRIEPRFGPEHVHCLESLDEAVEACLSPDVVPSLIVVRQETPDQYPSNEVDELLGVAPLARVVCLYEPACTSDGRTRNHWPPALRCPIEQAEVRIDHELAALDGTRESLPWSAARDEVFLADYESGAEWTADVSVAVDSPDPALRQFYRDVFAVEKETGPANVVVFDVDPWTAARAAALKAAAEQSRVVAVGGWLPADFVQEVLEHGAAAVVLKTAPLRMLIGAVGGAVG